MKVTTRTLLDETYSMLNDVLLYQSILETLDRLEQEIDFIVNTLECYDEAEACGDMHVFTKAQYCHYERQLRKAHADLVKLQQRAYSIKSDAR